METILIVKYYLTKLRNNKKGGATAPLFINFNMRKLFILILFIATNLSGQEVKQINVSEIIKNSNEALLSDLTDSIRYIKLETTPECLIGKIGTIKIIGDKIIIHDKTTNLLYAFSVEGKYLNKIGSIGKGPGEYTNLRAGFVMDYFESTLYVINGSRKVLIEYDLDGNLVREIPTKFYVSKLAITKEHLVCYTSSVHTIAYDSTIFHVLNRSGEVVSKAHEVDIEPNLVEHSSFLFNRNGRLFYWERPWHEIYSYYNGSIRVEYHIDYGKHGMPKSVYSNYETFPNETKNYILIDMITIYDSMLYIGIMNRNYQTFYYYFKDGRKLLKTTYDKEVPGYEIENDIDSGPNFSFELYLNPKEVCHVCEPFELKEHISKRSDALPNDSWLVDTINSLDVMDNPILQIIVLR